MPEAPPPSTNRYAALGVSHKKEEVAAAVAGLDHGEYPEAFCRITPDIAGDPAWCTVFHADGAGTKSSLAYLVYKETGDLAALRGIAQDALVMNTDDMLCVGAVNNFVASNTIGRNKGAVTGAMLAEIIGGFQEFLVGMTGHGVRITLSGGETADVGDLVRTFIVDATLAARVPRDRLILPSRIVPGDVIVGLASDGQATYETRYNCGMGSNGLTLARHGVLSHEYYDKYPECFDPSLPERLVFQGRHTVEEPLPGTPCTVGEALLSPTRTYLPIVKQILDQALLDIHMLLHVTGGAYGKCLHFGQGLRYVVDSPFPVPPLFRLIQASSGASWEEMYQVFNMGCRLQVICPQLTAEEVVIPAAAQFGVAAQIIGRVEEETEGTRNEALVATPNGVWRWAA